MPADKLRFRKTFQPMSFGGLSVIASPKSSVTALLASARKKTYV